MNKQKGNILGVVIAIIAVIAIVLVVGMAHKSSSNLGGNFNPVNQDAYSYSVYGTPVISHTGSITSKGDTSSSPTGGIGYSTGAGCAVTQATNRTTGVTCTGNSGTITTNSTSLAAEAAAQFTVTDTSVAIGDTIVLSQQSGSNGGNTDVVVTAVAAGSFKITVANNNAAAGTAETGAILLNFAVIKAVSS